MHYNSIIVVIIVNIIFISPFLLCCLLYNHSFKTNPNSTTNLSKLFNYIAPASLFLYIFQVINKNGPDGVHFTKHDERTLEDFCKSISSAVDKVQSEDLTGDMLRRTLMFLRKQMVNVRAQLRAVRLVAPRRHLERLIEEAVFTGK